MNELKSYTEYAVSTPTADFVIGFDFNYGEDAVNVTVDNVPASEAGYTVVYLNETTIRLSPSVPSGVVRLQRETDIDTTDNQFTVGAKFTAQTMDANFEQLRHSQQEVRDGFSKLKDDIGFTNLEQTIQAVHIIANEVEGNVVQSQTLLADTTAQAVLAQDYANSANSASTAAQQAASDTQQVFIDVSTAEAAVYSALADQTQTVTTALSNLSTVASKFYPTLAQANADIANIAVNQVVNIDEVANGGLWYKATAEATTLTKSAYDPLTQAKGYTDEQIEERWAFSYSIKHPVIIRDKSTGRGVPLLNSKGNLVGTLEGNTLGQASEVGGGGFEIKLLSGRRDALLTIQDTTTGQGVVLIDALGRIGGTVSSSASLEKPAHSDRVLSDMIDNGSWRGDWSSKEKYSALDVVVRTGKYYVCHSSVSVSETPPDADVAHWEYLPLVTNQGVIVEDNFRLNSGAANNRAIQPNQQWKLSGTGFANGVVANEYMTSATNTYYFLVNFTHKITEISTVERFVGIDGVEGNHTLAISYMSDWNTVSGFQNMWHINWGTGAVGSITYWRGSNVANGWTTGKIKISKGLKADKDGVAYKHTAKLRGNFIFGYLDDELAYIHCDDLIGEMTANAKAFYVQNHFANLGQERIEKVIVKSGVLS